MGFVATTYRGQGSGSLSGSLWWARPDWVLPVKVNLPFGVSAGDITPNSAVEYEGRSYLCGGHSANLVLDEHQRLYKLGIVPPSAAPSVAATGTGVTYTCYLTFYDRKTNERSTLSAGFDVIGSSPTTRTWTNLPIRPPDEEVLMLGSATSSGTAVTGTQTLFGTLRPGDRIALSSDPTRFVMVTAITDEQHLTVDASLAGASGTITVRVSSRVTDVELWVSADGTAPRLAIRRDIGTTTAVESTPTLALGEAFLDTFERFPKCGINSIYHDRHFLAGDPKNPDTVYLSLPFFPERYSGLNFRTRNGEAVTALISDRNYLMVCTAESNYLFQGFTEDDFVLVPQDTALGCFSKDMWCSVLGNKWIANNRGVFLYNGNWHCLTEDRADEWQQYVLEVDSPSLQEAISYVNPIDRVARFGTWAADYSTIAPELSGGYSAPRWSGENTTHDSFAAAYLKPANSSVGKMYYGNPGNSIIKKDDATVAGASSILRTQHLLLGDNGGDVEDGKELTRLWTYMQSEISNWILYVFGGDTGDAVTYDFEPTLTSMWTDEVAGTQLIVAAPPNVVTYGAITVHTHPVDMDASRGFSLEIRIHDPLNVIFSGFGGTWGPSGTTRPPAVVDPE